MAVTANEQRTHSRYGAVTVDRVVSPWPDVILDSNDTCVPQGETNVSFRAVSAAVPGRDFIIFSQDSSPSTLLGQSTDLFELEAPT